MPWKTLILCGFATQKKNRPQGSYVLKNSSSSAPPGAQTLDTLIKSYTMFCLILLVILS